MQDSLIKRIKELEKENDRLLNLLNKYKYDSLTGFMTRKDLIDLIDNLNQTVLAYDVFMYDANNLKKVNTEQGYIAGDKYLKDISVEITRTIRNGNYFRIGGDEFIIVKEVDNDKVFLKHNVSNACSSAIRIYTYDETNITDIINKLNIKLAVCKAKCGRRKEDIR